MPAQKLTTATKPTTSATARGLNGLLGSNVASKKMRSDMGAIYPNKPKKRKPAFSSRASLPAQLRSTTAAPVIFIPSAVIAPERVAKIERAGIGRRADSRSAQAADNSACSSIAGERANRRAGAGTQKAA
jgi:hypothetical protein